jgi:hypothetical protein
MNINRNNYEEYFLLYADNELSAEQKNMVDMFIQQNSDLEEEFIMLQQSVLKPDETIEYNSKSFLFREDAFINESNYEEKFLLYADKELSLFEIEKIEIFVLSNPSLQKEFSLLQQVKYKPDTSIVFPGKRSLYKKEDDSKVVPFRWKTLAAAVFLGVGLWSGVSYLQSNKAVNENNKAVATNQKKSSTELPVKPVEQKDDTALVTTNTISRKTQQNTFDKAVKKQTQLLQNVTVKNIQPVNKPEVNMVEKNPELENENVAIVSNKTDLKKSKELPQPINITTETNDKTITTTPGVEKGNYVQPASYIADSEIKSENYVFYHITTEEFRKSKVGTFFKKLKRAVERKIPLKNDRFKIGTAAFTKEEQN